MINYPERTQALYALLNPCRLCPHRCGINRVRTSKGKCRSGGGKSVFISSYNIHLGEEPPISAARGSGTIFFTNCSLSCVFCQNYPISQLRNGNEISVEQLSLIMLELQQRGAHNINFVTPTHYVAQIVEAVGAAREKGLVIPLVYNCSGYEEVETLKLLDGIIDIYMPDMKYSDDVNAVKYSSAPNYTETNRKAIKEMHRQVGELRLDTDDVAVKGLIIRHLVLPNNISGSARVLEFIAKEISPKTFISLMSQYHPANKTERYPELSRKVSAKEYKQAVKLAENLGLDNGWIQEI